MLEFHKKEELANYSDHELERIIKPNVGVLTRTITCPNLKCSKLWINYSLWSTSYKKYENEWKQEKEIYNWQLLPESEAKVLPDYIPKAIQEDYYEACRIRDLSPKASATLSRRCLQGMIRDFWNIKKGKLSEEIKALEDKVDPLEWEAIDSVRSVGNIGAHMEKDINVIIDVDPQEAQLLISLIEQLVDDWYISRFEKQKKLKAIKSMAQEKKDQKHNSNSK